VEKRDTAGGSGANFIVEWSVEDAVNVPIVETVMISVDKSHNLNLHRERGLRSQRGRERVSGHRWHPGSSTHVDMASWG
jgi:hypothetical protein